MTPWVTRLIIANVVVYLISMIAPGVVNAFMLVPAYVLVRPWTLVTYMFLHGGMWHIFFNMLGLFFFGPRLEVELGGRDFLLLYLISGLTGAILSFLTPFAMIVGASGAVYGVLLGFARYWPREKLYIWGILPIEARWLVVIMTALSLFGGFGGTGDNIAHFAHLGGFAGGYLFLRWRDRHTKGASQVTLVPPAPRTSDLARWSRIKKDGMHEVNRAELERIETKIRTSGVASLTVTERGFLDRFSSA
jgi:membrane associated rhomboid family serine protease